MLRLKIDELREHLCIEPALALARTLGAKLKSYTVENTAGSLLGHAHTLDSGQHRTA
jgi:hypothetical protein